ncbi:MAG: hypothetical protein K0V04_30630, partial [Deltaproteobacteria bacterium]|nr:hypothetical protein [Deltaproteobacteria bacterium]
HERITLDAPRHHATLARQHDTWPAEQQAAERALQLVGLCTPHQRRAFVRHWAEAWEAGSTTADAWLRRASETQLASLVDRRLAQGDTRLAQLLRPHGGLTIRTLLQRWGDRYPQALAHLRAPPPTSEAPPESNDAQDPEDPIDGKDVAQLVTLIDTKGVARGLAVRAVHALARHGERGAAPLDRLVTDRRPPVRSAALRALRKVASRELTMAATARVMGMETRSDVIVQLMRSLGHGRHAPALPTLIERLDHRDPRVRQTAHDAVLAWGPEVLPALRRAWKRVRPDRRPALALLVDELEASH